MPNLNNAEAWNSEHSKALLRGLIQIIVIHRTELYTLNSLEGVSNNHGDRIRKKTHQMLKQLCELYPGCEKLVEEELKKLTGRGHSTKGEETLGGKGEEGGKGKKRKVQDEVDE